MRRQTVLITTKKKCIEKMHVDGKEIEFKNLKKKILTPSSTGLSHKGPVPEYQDDRQSFLQNQLRVHPKMV